MHKILCFAFLLCILGSSSAWSALARDIGIADFSNITKSQEIENYRKAIPTLIFTTLANSQKLSLVTRQELDKLLHEMGLTDIEIVDPETAAKVGRMAGAKYMFIGQLSTFQGNKGIRIQITTQLVDVESARMVAGWSIEASKDNIDHQAIKMAHNILDLLFPISPKGATLRSILLPGWGQLASHRKSGYVFPPITIAAIGVSAYAQKSYNQAQKDYEEIQNRDFKTYIDLQNAKDKRDNRNMQRWLAFGTLAGIWVGNIIDAYLGAKSLNEQQQLTEKRLQSNLYFNNNEAKLVLAVKF